MIKCPVSSKTATMCFDVKRVQQNGATRSLLLVPCLGSHRSSTVTCTKCTLFKLSGRKRSTAQSRPVDQMNRYGHSYQPCWTNNLESLGVVWVLLNILAIDWLYFYFFNAPITSPRHHVYLVNPPRCMQWLQRTNREHHQLVSILTEDA